MTRPLAALLLLVLALAQPAFLQPALAQTLAGRWQGVLPGETDARIAIQLQKSPGGYLGSLYSIGQTTEPAALEGLAAKGSTLDFYVARYDATFSGKLEADGKRLTGLWTPAKGAAQPISLARAAGKAAWIVDPSPHTTRFIETDDHVKLEVLDWGGAGRPVVFLAGLGATGHTFDAFIPKLGGKYHVYAITRRGRGASDHPDPAHASYAVDRLADDVLQALDALKLEKPVLVGHSIAGQELSSIGSRHPERVAALAYLDAGYAYSFYAPGNVIPGESNLWIDVNDLRAAIARITAPGASAAQAAAEIDTLLDARLPDLKADLEAARVAAAEDGEGPAGAAPRYPHPIDEAIVAGARSFTHIEAPILALFASPFAIAPDADAKTRAATERLSRRQDTQIQRFAAGLPKARVVRIPNAQHAIFRSNPDDVARELTAFIDGLK